MTAPTETPTPDVRGDTAADTAGPAGDGARLRRRGLIAGAAALAAALTVAQPVRAAPLVGPPDYTGTRDPNPDGVQGYAAMSGNAGVAGRNNDYNGVGVIGTAPSGIGVSGGSSSGPGVSGTATVGPGVYAQSSSGLGLLAYSTSSYGVLGSSGSSHGVYGQASTGIGVVGSAITTGVGVAGFGTTQPGSLAGLFRGNVYIADGSLNINAPAGFGLACGAAQAGYAGVYALASSPGVYGLVAAAHNNQPGQMAALFRGDVRVDGNFAVLGTKSAAVPFPDGSRRLVYSVESPESWLEDFGESALANGRALVRLDADFATTVLVDNYHVFLTPYGDASLYVSARTPAGFTVQERGGTSGTTFSWRVVAKRKDVAGTRLARVDAPPAFTLPLPPARAIPDDLQRPPQFPDVGGMRGPTIAPITPITVTPAAGTPLPPFAAEGGAVAPARAMAGAGDAAPPATPTTVPPALPTTVPPPLPTRVATPTTVPLTLPTTVATAPPTTATVPAAATPSMTSTRVASPPATTPGALAPTATTRPPTAAAGTPGGTPSGTPGAAPAPR